MYNKVKIGKLILTIAIMFFSLCLIYNQSLAMSLSDFEGGSVSGEGELAIKGIMSAILSIIQMVGAIVSILVLVIIGIKYMTGSIDEKVEYKKKLMPYAVGAFILFAGTAIPTFVFEFSQSAF